MVVLAIAAAFILVAIQLKESKSGCVIPILLLTALVSPVMAGLVMVFMLIWAVVMSGARR